MKKFKAALVQINNSFADACYFPYSIGVLQAYFQKHSLVASDFEFFTPIYRRLPVANALQHLAGADIVGFSVYSWNFQLSLEIARRYKELKPAALIIFGGPHVPHNSFKFLTQYAFVDLACHGEGEIPFMRILENFAGRSWENVPGISYLENGRHISHPEEPRLNDLALVPSPYLEGTFAPLLQADANHQWLGLWETNRGCPFSCAYCDWGAATKSKLYTFDLPRLTSEIDWFAAHRIEFIFCCDSNFGILPRDLEIVAAVAAKKNETGFPQALSVQNTKNADRSYEIQKALADAGLSKGVNLAMQTMNPETLRLIGRQNIPGEMFQDLQRRYARDGIETFSDIILGLPGETYASFVEGVDRIIENGQHNRIQFINLSILPNAPMADPAYGQRHGFTTVETKIINIHGAPSSAVDDIDETQELVVGTATMPPEDWRRAKAFAWMASFLYFNKLLQIPMALLHEMAGLGYSEQIEAFMAPDPLTAPILAEMVAFFFSETENIQQGGAEFYLSKEWLNIYWPHDEYALIQISTSGKLEEFYDEAGRVFAGLLTAKGLHIPMWLHEALRLNRNLLKQPFHRENLQLKFSHDLLACYRSIVSGHKSNLVTGDYSCEIDRTSDTWQNWRDWCKEVVWYCNKKGAYLYRECSAV